MEPPMALRKDQILYEKGVCPHCNTDVFVRYQREPQLQILGIVDTDGVVTNTKSTPDINTIYDFWNSQHIIVHRSMTTDIAKTIKAELKNYSDVEILQAIKNYSEIQRGDQYWFNYAWTLKDFLKRGISKFFDLEIAKNNYLIKEAHPKGIPSHKWCRNCGYKALTTEIHCPKCTARLDKNFTAGKYGHVVKG